MSSDTLDFGPTDQFDPSTYERPPHGPFRGRWRQIAPTVEAAIVPRLTMVNGASARARGSLASAAGIDSGTVDFFVLRLLATGDAYADFVETLLARPIDAATVYLDLFAPAARLLGEGWSDDRLTFAEVTVALTRLHGLLRRFPMPYVPEADGDGRNVLLLATPGEQHVFGLGIVDELFRAAGWNSTYRPEASEREIESVLRRNSFAIVGFTVSCDNRIAMLARSIGRVRRTSANRSVGILVGGLALADRPDLVAQIGADAAAVDARHALVQARRLAGMTAAARA